MTTRPARRTNHSIGNAYDRLKQAIVTGEIQPGDALVEVELAAMLGVSRTPIREALRKLEADGLVARGLRGGLEVRARSPEEILDIYEVRILLEGEAARLAAMRASQLDLIRLQRLVDRSLSMREEDQDIDAWVAINKEFHQELWAACHSEPLQSVLARLSLHLLRYPATTLAYPGRWTQAIQDHAEIVKAIRERDPARAGELARRHFTEARDIRLRLWEEQ